MVSFQGTSYSLTSLPEMNDQEVFDYAQLMFEGLTTDEALEILRNPPSNAQRKDWAISNAVELVVRFQIPRLPDWMGYPPDAFRKEYLCSDANALWREIQQINDDAKLAEELRKTLVINDLGETIFHHACKWNDPNKFHLIEWLITHLFTACVLDDDGTHPFEHIHESESELLVDLLCRLRCSNTPRHEYAGGIDGFYWLELLFSLNNLDLALRFSERNPQALLKLDFKEQATNKNEIRFIDDIYASNLRILHEREIPFETIQKFHFIWDMKMKGKTGYSSDIFYLEKITVETVKDNLIHGRVDHEFNRITTCLNLWLEHHSRSICKSILSYLIKTLLSCCDNVGAHLPTLIAMIDQVLNYVNKFKIFNHRDLLVLKNYIDSESTDRNAISQLLFRLPHVYQSSEMLLPRDIHQKILESTKIEEFDSEAYTSMTPKAKIDYLEAALPAYPKEKHLDVLQSACPFILGSKKLNRFVIDKGYKTISLGASIFDEKHQDALKVWIESGGWLSEEYPEIEWTEAKCVAACNLISQYPAFKRHFKKYINPYTESSKKIRSATLELVIACEKSINQQFFYSPRAPQLLDRIYEHRGYLILTEKQNLTSQKLNDRRKKWMQETKVAYIKLRRAQRLEVTDGNFKVNTSQNKSKTEFIITVTYESECKKSEIQHKAFFNEIGHGLLVAKLKKELLKSTHSCVDESPKSSAAPAPSARTKGQPYIFEDLLPISHRSGLVHFIEFKKYPDSETYYVAYHNRVPPKTLIEPSAEMTEQSIKRKINKWYLKQNKNFLDRFYHDLRETYPDSHGDPRNIHAKNSSSDILTSRNRIEVFIANELHYPIDLQNPDDKAAFFLTKLAEEPDVIQEIEQLESKKTDLENMLDQLRNDYIGYWGKNERGSGTINVHGKRTIDFAEGSPAKIHRAQNDAASTLEIQRQVSFTSILETEQQITQVERDLEKHNPALKYALKQGYFYFNNLSKRCFFSVKGMLRLCKYQDKFEVKVKYPPSSDESQSVIAFASSSSSSSSSAVDDARNISNKIMCIKEPIAEPLSEFHKRFKIIRNWETGEIEILDYKHPTNQDIALFLSARHDPNGALAIDQYAQRNLLTLSDEYSIMFRKVGSNLELLERLRQCLDGSIGNLWIAAHATGETIVWGQSIITVDSILSADGNPIFDTELATLLTKKLKPGASIFLEACSSGAPRDFKLPNMADYFAGLAKGHQVIAPKIDLSKTGKKYSEIILEGMFPLRCRIMQNGLDMTYNTMR